MRWLFFWEGLQRAGAGGLPRSAVRVQELALDPAGGDIAEQLLGAVQPDQLPLRHAGAADRAPSYDARNGCCMHHIAPDGWTAGPS